VGNGGLILTVLRAFPNLNKRPASPALLVTRSQMDRYQKTEKGGAGIGEGAYGVVYKGKDKKTGEIVAMKVRTSLPRHLTAALKHRAKRHWHVKACVRSERRNYTPCPGDPHSCAPSPPQAVNCGCLV
jgi:hypothetical protein